MPEVLSAIALAVLALAGVPTLANPNLPFVPNPNFGQARATLPGREIQLGLKWVL